MNPTENPLPDYENASVLNVCGKYPFFITKGRGMHVFDSTGKKWLDLYGGHAVAITGHCHPEVVQAIIDQSQQLLFYSNVTYSQVRADVGALLVQMSPSNLTKVYFGNSGAEANEAAIKFARKFTEKPQIIAMENGFHGRTYGALSITWGEKYRKPFRPLVPEVDFVPFGDIESFQKQISSKTAAVIIEPIQSVAGVNMENSEYYKALRDITSDKKILLIFDEIQTGLGRTGKPFFGDHFNIEPDMITVAKGLASGIPISATIITENISNSINPGDHASTFGGGPVACAAAKATLNVILKEKLIENAAKVGEYAKNKLSGHRGLGLLIGIEANPPNSAAVDLITKARSKDIIIGGSGNPKVARLLPPLTVTTKHIDQLLEAINNE